MAIAIDVPNLGTATGDPGSTTIAFTTGSAVASSGFIVLSVGWFATTALSSVSGGGLTWTIDNQGRGPGGNSTSCAVVSAQAPSGLASGTTITATFAASSVARMIGGTSFTGVKTTTPAEATDLQHVNPAATGWTTGSVALSAGSMLFAATYDETSNTTSTPTSPSVEALDFNYAGGTTMTSCYRIESSANSYTVAGTFAANATSTTIGVAYLAAAGTSAASYPLLRRSNAHLLSR